MHMHHQKHWDTPESLTKEALKALASMRLVTMLLSCTAEATHGVVWGEFLPTPHCALNSSAFERLPITGFAGAWSSTLRSLLLAFTFASLFALTCTSAALSMGRMC